MGWDSKATQLFLGLENQSGFVDKDQKTPKKKRFQFSNKLNGQKPSCNLKIFYHHSKLQNHTLFFLPLQLFYSLQDRRYFKLLCALLPTNSSEQMVRFIPIEALAVVLQHSREPSRGEPREQQQLSHNKGI